jgi:hypothetical protein
MSTHSKLDHALRHIVHRVATSHHHDKDTKQRGAPDRSELVAGRQARRRHPHQ